MCVETVHVSCVNINTAIQHGAGLFLVVALALANQHAVGIKSAADKAYYLVVGAGGEEAAHGVLLFVDGSKIRKRIEPATPQPKNVTNG